jgi:hypothetical protein
MDIEHYDADRFIKLLTGIRNTDISSDDDMYNKVLHTASHKYSLLYKATYDKATDTRIAITRSNS